ncbi:hypothetical protein L228DRAFT_271863 [Xylona heveae TC161]|uniref:Fanconi-associated nuclease n=1 Tax=Xylona heveae (strain CBS 132557 / TC161) TaxID=1328760 RepID=A0A165J862_XYLHT|nr:hypothetical protein L228DRAFT_271863 [Xylona heveae TC161]KZF25878.1 hypothetical protein L228DRAFT_271863 [Xylona heveae TC161]
MLGYLIKPSKEEDLSRPSKRLKTFDSIESSSADSPENSPEAFGLIDRPTAVSDSDDGSIGIYFQDDLKETELESALPHISNDQEAIAEYELRRTADDRNEASNFAARLESGKWARGKSSIYVDAFNLALETVLEEEAHLFDRAELALFEHWRSLGYEAQYLYVRLFLRKTSAWHRVNEIKYHSDIADLPAAVEQLQTPRDIPSSTHLPDFTYEAGDSQEALQLKESFTFADDSNEEIGSLEEALNLLRLDELKSIAKDARIQGKNKAELIAALQRNSQNQKPPPNGVTADTPAIRRSKETRDGHFLGKIMEITGPCIRLSLPALQLFERVHLVFYRSTEWTEKSLITVILAKISRRTFPEYLVSRSLNIFTSRSALLEFEASIRTQHYVDSILEFGGTPRKDDLQRVLDVFDKIYPRWNALLRDEEYKDRSQYDLGEGAYLRRFSPAWVYTRIVHKGAHVLGRLKYHKREHSVLTELLNQRLFHLARRGDWYIRKALLEEHYMAAIEPDQGRNPEAQKKHWKRIALQTCEEGLQDRDCHIIYHYDLQKRIMKLEKSLKVAKREQHDFSHVRLIKPKERVVEGIRIEKDEVLNRRTSETGKGGKTVWIDEYENGGFCSVEEMCLSWYRTQGWKGYHSEGGVIRTLFGYLFFEILFLYIPNVFQTAYQTCPLDLHTDAFFPTRMSEINHRLMEIANGESERIIKAVHAKHCEKKTCVVGLDWAFALDDLVEIAKCFEGEALATICKVMAQDYQKRGGGVPDLFLWHPVEKKVMFSEVKSENDRLSDTQRLWIHVLTGAGVEVELCNAVAKELRHV